MAAAISVGTLTLAGGTLNGGATLTVDNGFTWSGGTMSGAGTTTVAPGAGLAISGSPVLDRSEERRVGKGGGWRGTGQMSMRSSAVFNNSGVLEAHGDGLLRNDA